MVQIAHVSAMGTPPSHDRLDIKHLRSIQSGKMKKENRANKSNVAI